MPKIVTKKKKNRKIHQVLFNKKAEKKKTVPEVKYSASVHSLETTKGNLKNYQRARVLFQLKLCIH